jgi:head-tail adaptor
MTDDAFAFPHGEPVTVHTATTTEDRYGNETSTWSAGTTYDRCVISRRTSDDLTDSGRQGVVVGLSVFLPYPEAQIDLHDRLELRGAIWEIVGEPYLYHHAMTGWEPGIGVAVQRVEG